MRFEDRVKALFDAVVSHPAPDWERLVDASDDDSAVKGEVRRLLEIHAKPTGFLSRPAAESFPAMVRTVGSRLGEFTLLREIGRGGMGIVYLAEDSVLGRTIALKVLASHALTSDHDIARFRTEAKAAARLSHPGIVPVHRYGEQDGTHYIAMEYVEGETLADRLERMRRGEGGAGTPADRDETTPSSRNAETHSGGIESRQYVRDVLRILSAVADALDYAHQRGVIHRDVKPSNILLTAQGDPRLTDFGVARIGANQSITVTGEVAGTYSYMSPEQARAQHAQVDHRTDIFSLGVVLYECLTLRRPFTGESAPHVIQALTSTDPPPIRTLNPAVSRDLAIVCGKALEKRPGDRFPTAGHLAAELRCCLTGEPILTAPPSLRRRAMKQFKKHRAVIIGSAMAIFVVLAIAMGYLNWRAHMRSLGRISISLGAPLNGGVVWAQRVGDKAVHEGDPILLGSPPVHHAALAPGLYRFSISGDGGRFVEFDEFLIAARPVERIVWARTTNDLQGGMVLFAAGEYPFTLGDLQTGEPKQDRLRIEEMLIDQAEISNRQYEAFLRETGRDPPYVWPPGGIVDTWADLPVTGLTLDDATAYAVWAGKRLPTIWEWAALAQAPDGRLYPWGSGPPPDSAVPSDAVLREQQNYSQNGAVEMYARRTRAGDETRTPAGLVNTFGNVSEMTGTVYLYTAGGGRIAVPNMVIARSDWTSDPTYTNLSSFGLISHLERGSPRIGFRCVRTARPTIQWK